MNEFLWLMITLAAGIAGGVLLLKLNVPAGAMLGSLVLWVPSTSSRAMPSCLPP